MPGLEKRAKAPERLRCGANQPSRARSAYVGFPSKAAVAGRSGRRKAGFKPLTNFWPTRSRSVWGTARVIEGDAALIERLMPEDYKATPEQVILFTVTAWNGNCRQHIPQRIDTPDVALALSQRDARIAELEAELTRFRTSPQAG